MIPNSSLHNQGENMVSTRAPASALIRLRLRLVATVDFRFGVPHHWVELKKERNIRLQRGETVLMISQTKYQLAWVVNDSEFDDGRGQTVRGITHLRTQLDKHRPFNPKMLQNYANDSGIELDGAALKRFEDYMKADVKKLGMDVDRWEQKYGLELEQAGVH